MDVLPKDIILIILRKVLKDNDKNFYNLLFISKKVKNIIYLNLMKEYFEKQKDKAFNHVVKNSLSGYYKTIKVIPTSEDLEKVIIHKRIDLLEYILDLVSDVECTKIIRNMYSCNSLRDPKIFVPLLEKKRELFFNPIWRCLCRKVKSEKKIINFVNVCRELEINGEFISPPSQLFLRLIRSEKFDMLSFFIKRDEDIYNFLKIASQQLKEIVQYPWKTEHKLLTFLHEYILKSLENDRNRTELSLGKETESSHNAYYMVKYGLKMTRKGWGLKALEYVQKEGRHLYCDSICDNIELDYTWWHLLTLTENEKLRVLQIAALKNKNTALILLKSLDVLENFNEDKVQIVCEREDLVPIIYMKLMDEVDKHRALHKRFREELEKKGTSNLFKDWKKSYKEKLFIEEVLIQKIIEEKEREEKERIKIEDERRQILEFFQNCQINASANNFSNSDNDLSDYDDISD